MALLRGAGEVRRVATVGLAILLVASAAIIGLAVPAAVRADCGSQGPGGDIRSHQGFALEGTVRSVEGRREPSQGWLYRVTVDVSEMLVGEAVATVAFDLGTGDCWHLQGDRYKAGDRLIVTASAPPSDGPVAYLPDALTWRYEWADRWSFHGLPEDLARTMPGAIRQASTRDEILALVAPQHLPYRVDPSAWSVSLARPARDEHLIDVVPWGDGFVALGGRTVNRHQGPEERVVPMVWISATGDTWEEVRSPFPEVTEQASSVARLAVFRDRLYAFGIVGGRFRVWASEDGRSWSGSGPDGAAGLIGRRVVVGAAATDERLVAMTGPWQSAGEPALEGCGQMSPPTRVVEGPGPRHHEEMVSATPLSCCATPYTGAPMRYRDPAPGQMTLRFIDDPQRIATALIARIVRDRPGAFIASEMGIALGAGRIDLAVVDDTLSGFEIKGAKDSLDRLPRQVVVYGQVFERLTLVTSECHARRAVELLPDWWGIDLIEGEEDAMRPLRSPSRNPELRSEALAQLLWRDEVAQLLKARGIPCGREPRRKLWDKLVGTYAETDLLEGVRRTLREREGWRASA